MTQQTSVRPYTDPPPVNYERYFVPAIGAPLAHDLIELAELRPGERVVDVACGTGVVTRLAAERVGDATVAGVDISPGVLAVARQAAGDAAIEWHEGSAESLPLADRSFDVALCQMGLQFVHDRPAALRELHRVLAPGGRAVLNVPGPTPPALAVLEELLRRHLGPEAAGFVATVFSLHDPGELRALLEEAGFAEVQARSEGRTLHLGPPQDFVWQYLSSTPVAAAAGALDPQEHAELQREFAAGCESFVEDDELVVEVGVTSAAARRD